MDDIQLPTHVGQILLVYAYYGVILTGFDWEKSCWFFSDAGTTVLQLNVSDLECNNYTNFTLQAELQAFTNTYILLTIFRRLNTIIWHFQLVVTKPQHLISP